MHMTKKHEGEKFADWCPEGNDPMYCHNCFAARLGQTEARERASKRAHGLL